MKTVLKKGTSENSAKLQREKTFFDKLATEQQQSWWGHRTFAGQERQKRRARLVVKFLSPISESTRILEIGCGAGDFTQYLASELPPCLFYGIDISEGLLKVARKRITKQGIEFLNGDVEDIDPNFGNFNAVIGASILHHVDVSRTLASIYKVLVPGGKILFMEPNMLNPQIWLEKNIRFIGRMLQNTDDETAFFKKEMFNFLKDANFTDMTVEPFDFMHPAFPKFLVPSLRKICEAFEKIAIVKEFAGSLMITARKPS